MRKIFTFFLALLLSVSSLWAATWTASFSWNTDVYANYGKASHPTYDVSVWLLTMSKNYPGSGDPNCPMIQLHLTMPKGSEKDYGNVSCVPEGTYTFSSSTNWADHSGQKHVMNNSSYYSFCAPANLSTAYQFSSGSLTVAQGANGAPYITVSLKSGTNTCNYTIGQKLQYTTTVSTSDGTTNFGKVTLNTQNRSYPTSAASMSKTTDAGATLYLKATDINSTAGTFEGWSKDGGNTIVSTNNPYQISANGNATYTAVFTPKAGGTLTINSCTNGQFKVGSGAYQSSSFSQEYDAGTTVTLTAQAADGYWFAGWGDGNTQNPRNYSISGDATLSPTFRANWTLTVTSANESMGTVTGSGSFGNGVKTTITATPKEGYAFAQWNDGDKNASRQVTVTGNTTYTATFVKAIAIVTDGYSNLRDNCSSMQVLQVRGVKNDAYKVYVAVAGITSNSRTGSFGINTTYSWITDMDGNNRVDFTEGSVVITKSGDDITAVATLNGNDGNLYIITQKYDTPISWDQETDLERTIAFGDFGPDAQQNTTTIESREDNEGYLFGVDFWGVSTYIATGEYELTTSYQAGCARALSGEIGSIALQHLRNVRVDGVLYNDYYYQWPMRHGKVNVINPNHTEQPMYMYVDAQNSFGRYLHLTMGTKPALRTITVGEHVTMKSLDDAEAQTGTKEYYNGTNLTLVAGEVSGYHFLYWEDDHSNTNATRQVTISANTTYSAVYELDVVYYTVTLTANEGGSAALYSDADCTQEIAGVDGVYTVEENTTVYAKAIADKYYHFQSWSSFEDGGEGEFEPDAPARRLVAMDEDPDPFVDGGGIQDNPLEITVTVDVSYTANFAINTTSFDLEDEHVAADAYYTAYDAIVGNTIDVVTYKRTLAAGYWHAISLPFKHSFMLHPESPLNGHVYELDDAAYVGNELILNFLTVTTWMEANKPYIYFNSESDLTDPVFTGVTLQSLEDASYNVTCSTGGSVSFVNTTSLTPLFNLHQENRDLIFIYQNQLYYPSASVNMCAFRGYFLLDGVRSYNAIAPRVRIAVDGEPVDVTTAEEQTEQVQKYVENGVLVIERNGVKYIADGKRM